MNFSIRNFSILITAVFLFTLCAQLSAQTPAESLDEDFKALATYEFGTSNAPVLRVADAVRAALAGHPDGPYSVQELEARLCAILEAEAPLDAKRFICRLLGEIAGTRSIKTLAQQINDEALFSTALVALEQNPGSEAAAVLAAALKDAPTEKQIALMAAMGRQGNPDSIAVLAAALDNPTPEIALEAAQALADISLPEACQAVMSKIAAAPETAPLLMLDACLKCADTLCETDKEATTVLLEKLRQPVFPTHIRIAAIDTLMRCHPEKAQELLLAALQDDDAALSHQALMLARANADANVVAALTTLLEQAPAERKTALLAILSDFGDPSALPAVMTLADHEQPKIRIAALQAIGVLGNAAQADFLLTRATSGPMAEQRAAREVLVRLADPATDARLLSIATRAGDEGLRIRAIATLTERNTAEAAPSLLALAARAAPEIRKEAVRALRSLAPPEMLPELIGLITPHTLEPIRDLLPQTIAQTASRITDPLVQADVIIAALNEADKNDKRIVLLEALGLLGTDQAFEAVKSYPETTETDLRRAVVTALARFQSPDALGELRGILLTERDDAVRARAYSGYISSLRNASEVSLLMITPHIQTAFEQAKSAAERRDFLAAATQLPSLTTLNIIAEMAESSDVMAEAVQALVKTSVALAGAYQEEAGKHLNAIVVRENTPAPLVEEAKQALAFMERFDGYIMSWAVAGPYFEANVSADSLFSREFQPETEVENANWRIMRVLPDANPPYAIELDRVFGGEDRVAFLRTTVTTAETTDATLELGTNDGCRVWLNGTLIHALNLGRPLTPGEDKLPVELTAGENDLMVAVFQQGGAWGATARVVDKNGKPVSGLAYSPAVSE